MYLDESFTRTLVDCLYSVLQPVFLSEVPYGIFCDNPLEKAASKLKIERSV